MSNFKLRFLQKISLSEKFNFYEYIGVMLDGGVSISETLNSVQSKLKNDFFREKIKELQTYVSSGDSLSRSMKKIPQVFNSGEISIIESGESTGRLSEALMQLSENLRKTYDLQAKIKSALTYPFIIFVLLIFLVIVVLVYVIPALSELFENADVEFPLATKALIATSDFVINSWYVLLFGIATFAVFFYGYKNTERGRANIDFRILKLPLIGKVYRNYLLAAFSTNLGVLISSGVPVVKALDLSGKSLNNMIYEALLHDVKKRVSQGEKMTDSMQELDPANEYFPLDFLQLLSVGEKTASIDSVSKKLTAQYTREVNYSLAVLTKWIEPLAILIGGIFALWFAFAIFGAILKVTETVS